MGLGWVYSLAVYDCVLFFNELDLLELRLKTLWDYVDRFVIFEGRETFSGKPKPLHFMSNLPRFESWMEKISQITVPEIDGTPWEREFYARDHMPLGFLDAAPDDIIFQSDVDEIWDPEKLGVEADGPLVYGQRMFYYRLNTERVPRIVWYGSRRVRAGEWPGGQVLRNIKAPVLADGGWHFSFLGDERFAKDKLEAYAHTEYAHLDTEHIAESIRTGVDLINPTASYLPVPVDETFPKPITEDPSRWKHLIRS